MCQSGGKFERFTFQKITLCSNPKTCDFFGEALVVMCTINKKIKMFSLCIYTLYEMIHYIRKISPQSAIVTPLQQGAWDG